MRMTRPPLAALLVAAASAGLLGCSDEAPRVEVLAESPTLPDDGTEPDAALAATDAELAAAWDRFGFPGTPDVSLAEGPVIFVGTVESGSCPATVEYVGPPTGEADVDADVLVEVGHEGGPDCTTDAIPVTLVVRAPDVEPVRSVFVANGNLDSPLSGRVQLDR